MVSTINSHTSRASIAMMVAGIGIPLVKTMMTISAMQTLGASVGIARSSIRMIGMSSIAGISIPLVKTMEPRVMRMETLWASGLITHSSIGMVGQGGSITGISFSLVETMMTMQTLHTSVSIAGSTIRMIGMSSIAGLSSRTPNQSKF